jgi:hypothetical protein
MGNSNNSNKQIKYISDEQTNRKTYCYQYVCLYFSYCLSWLICVEFVFNHGSSVSTSQYLHVGIRSSNTACMAFYGGDDLDVAFIHPINTWKHYCGTYAYTTRLRKIFIDGQLLGSGTATGTFNPNGPIHIGKQTTKQKQHITQSNF